MAVIKTKQGYKSTKTGQFFSSQSKAIAADKGGSVTQSRDEQLSQIENTALKIQKGIQSSAASFTPEERAQLSAGLTQASAELAKKSQPSIPSASDVKKVQPYTAPTPTVPTGFTAEAMAGTLGVQTMAEIAQKQKDDALAREQQRQQTQKGLWDMFSKNQESPGEARERAMDEINFEADEHFEQTQGLIKEIETLDEQYNSLVAAKDQQIAQANDKMAPMNFINNQTAQIERNAAPQLNRLSANINAKAATLQALRGNFADAQAYVNQAVQDATAEAKFNYDMYKEMYEMNEDSFNRMDSIYKQSYETSMAIAQMEYETQKEEKEKVGELLLANPQAGIRMTDSLDEAFTKIGVSPMSPERRLLEAQIANTWSNAMGDAGGGSGTKPVTTPETSDMTELFNIVLSGLPKYEQERVTQRFNEYVNSGNTGAAQKLVNDLAVNGMTAEQKNRFTGFGIITNVFDNVAKLEQDFAATNPGVYRTLLEQTKPFAQISTDPRWQKYVSQVQGAVNAYRNEIFGASLTGNELKAANISLPDWNRDNYQTIQSKLFAMRQYANGVRESVLRDTTGQYSSDALGQTPTQQIPQVVSTYSEITEQPATGGWFTRFLNYLR